MSEKTAEEVIVECAKIAKEKGSQEFSVTSYKFIYCVKCNETPWCVVCGACPKCGNDGIILIEEGDKKP